MREGNSYAGHLPVQPTPPDAKTRRVAVVGGGPAGLAAAHDLALLGYGVTVFEAAAEPGGMVRFGIPEYRLPRTLIRAEIDKIVSLGVTLETRTPLSPAFGLAELRRLGFEAMFLAVGVSRGRDLQVPGVELDGVVKAVDYLLNVNQGFRMNLGRKVVVIGGGFVALDSARAALRGGATEVIIVSLENFDEMPVLKTTQGHEEFEEAQKEGVRFLPRRGPRRFLGDGRLRAVELWGVRSVFDASGRFAPEYDETDVTTIDADACVLAVGQQPDLSFLAPEDGVALNPNGTLKVEPETLATSAPGVFAGGDVAFGPRNLIEAVANGKRAARSIHRYLAGERARLEVTVEVEKLSTAHYQMLPGFELGDRETPPTLDLERRTGIAEVEVGYDRAAATRQAARCLVCHMQTIYDPETCVLCSRCVDVCPEYCLAIVPFEDLDLPDAEREALRAQAAAGGLPLSAMMKDDDRCIRCGLCAIRCPTDAMTMERFTITERWTSKET